MMDVFEPSIMLGPVLDDTQEILWEGLAVGCLVTKEPPGDLCSIRSRYPGRNIALVLVTHAPPKQPDAVDLWLHPEISDQTLHQLIKKLVAVTIPMKAIEFQSRIDAYESCHIQDDKISKHWMLAQPLLCWSGFCAMVHMASFGYFVPVLLKPLLIMSLQLERPIPVYFIVTMVAQTCVASWTYMMISTSRELQPVWTCIWEDATKWTTQHLALENGVLGDLFNMLTWVVLAGQLGDIGIGTYLALTGMVTLLSSFLEAMQNKEETAKLWLLHKRTHWFAIATAIGSIQFQLSKGTTLGVLAVQAVGFCIIKVRYVRISRMEAILEPAIVLISAIQRTVFACAVVVAILLSGGFSWDDVGGPREMLLLLGLCVFQVCRSLEKYAVFERFGATRTRVLSQLMRPGTMVLAIVFHIGSAESGYVYWAVALQSVCFLMQDLPRRVSTDDANRTSSAIYMARRHAVSVHLHIIRSIVQVVHSQSVNAELIDFTRRLKTSRSSFNKVFYGSGQMNFDALRLRMLVSTNFNQSSMDVFEMLLAHKGFRVLKIKNSHQTSNCFAYKDIHMVLWSVNDSIAFEIQLHSPTTYALSLRLRHHYSVEKDPDESTWNKLKSLTLRERNREAATPEPNLISIHEKLESLAMHVTASHCDC